MQQNYQAALEALRVFNLSAFNIRGCTTRRKVNGVAVLYTFPDGSMMQVNLLTIKAWFPGWVGRAHDKRLRPVKLPLRANKIGG